MAQFADVGQAVNAVQEILLSPYGSNIRKSPNPHLEADTISPRIITVQNALNYSTTIVRSLSLRCLFYFLIYISDIQLS